MGMLKLEVAHRLSKEEAKKRIAALAAHWVDKYGVKVDWVGDKARLSGKVMGIQLDATLEVAEAKVSGEATDPGFLLRDRAKKYLHERVSGALDPGKPAIET